MYKLSIKFHNGTVTTIESTSAEHLRSIAKSIYDSNVASYTVVVYDDGEIIVAFGAIV